MKIEKFLPVPLMVGFIAAIFMWFANQFSILSWVAFITWAGFFLSGISTRSAIREAISVTLGIAFGALIIYLNTTLTGTLGSLSLPLIVGIVAFVIVLLELVPWFDMAPGYFFGAAAFFAAGAKVEFGLISSVWIAAMIGLGLGVLTGYLRRTIFSMEGVKDPALS